MAGQKRGLGRGLSALMQEVPAAVPARDPVQPGPAAEGVFIRKIAPSAIVPNRHQPRREFDPAALRDLVESVQTHGVLQPLLVRPRPDGGYELIAGERRLRAALECGLSEVPAILKNASDEEMLELALIENLQRQDLNIIEEAEGYRELQVRFDMTQEQIAKRVGKGRATVANALRLLELEAPLRKLLADGAISAGHAKVLLGVEIPAERALLARRIVKEELSVRALERLVEQARRISKKPRAFKEDLPRDYVEDLVNRLNHRFGTQVRLTPTRTLANGKKMRGAIEVEYYNNEDLHRLIGLMGIEDESY